MVGSISDKRSSSSSSYSVVAPVAAFAVTSSQPPPSFHRRAIERDISGKLSYRTVINEKQGIYLPTNLTA